jgi:CheY-like chemotaxis protein
MTAQLRETHRELEQRVAERTAELVRARDDAESASRAKSEFLSSMSHELRTPMNAILGFAQLLASDPAQAALAQQHGYVREILRAGEHLMELINEVLDLARIEAGKLQLSLEPVNVPALVGECLTLLQPLAAEARVRLVEVPAAAGAAHVGADRTRLKQVLLNLVSNAIKYNREGGSVHVACARDGEAVRVSVSDTGPGLSAEQRSRLFQAFDRLGADQAAIEGTGIGLALSKRLVELMQGTIGVASEVGAGSTFWVRLDAAEPPGLGAVAVPLPLPVAPAPPARERTILYIEDNPVNALLMEAMIARQPGLRLLAAPLPALGLDLARTAQPDLILLDIQMPQMDGYEALRRLRAAEATRAIPVIAVTANALPGDVERGRAAGFVDYLVKPLDLAAVLAAVNRALGTAPG